VVVATATLVVAVRCASAEEPQPATPGPAPAQDAASPSSAPPPAPVPSAHSNPGLINEIDKLLKTPPLALPWLKTPQQSIEDLNAQTKDAADNLSRLTRPKTVVIGRAKCPVAANGAPDCKTASDALCKSKGFKEGQSLDTDAAETCSVEVLLSGRKPGPGDCRTDNFVTRALCQ
jgi:hypothetical protein